MFSETFSKKLRSSVGISGFISLIIGLLVLFFPGLTAQFGTILVGLSFILIGLVYFTSFITMPIESGWSKIGHTILGIIYIFAGVFALVNINSTTAVLFVVVGILVGMTWIYEGCLSFALISSTPSKGWVIFSGIISIIAGLALLFSPFVGAVTLWILLGIFLIIMGIFKIVQYFMWKI
ncbi:HdeD family acid-resistance protein [Lactococcus lactis]|uniref:HdeD family acid-resistance protein n=1 Tax=Lactococcus lactis TaxID=1358 RepID=UPI000512D98F|nr:DUF308 domain-containing protein [Lactococcus lactis]KGF76213.1 hypothetical protein Llab_1800 [Lactococcus lactis]